MINKHSKGKEHTRRPLPVRAIAILMAFAMVLSVLYINNRRNRVEAADDLTDSAFIKGNIIGDGTPLNDNMDLKYYVYVPKSGTYNMKFDTFPAFTGSTTTVKMLESDGKYSLCSDETEGAVNVGVAYTYGWYIGDTVATEVTPSNDGTALCLKKICTSYTLATDGTDITAKIAEGSKLDKTLITAKFISYTPSIPAYDTTSHEVYDDDDKLRKAAASSADTIYYGTVVYTLNSVGKTMEEITEAANALAENSTLPAVGKKIYTTIGSSNIDLFTETYSDLYSKNNTLLVNYWSKVGTADAQTSAASDSNTVSLTTIAPNATVQFGFSTDVHISTASADGEITVDKSEGAPAVTIKNDTGNEYYFEIPGTDPTANVGTFTYTVSLNDKKTFGDTFGKSETITFSVSYDSGVPTISGITVNDSAAAGDGNYYVNTTADSATIKATATKNSTNGTVNTVSLTGTDVTCASSVDSGTGAITGSVSGLKKGLNALTLNVTNSYGISSANSTVNVFYDPDAPTVTASISQTGYSGSGKLTCMKNVTVSFTPDDGTDGSGVKSVNVTDQDGTPVTTPITINASSANNGKSYTYTYTATDNAGNTSTAQTVTVEFMNEEATVEYSVSKDNYLTGDKIHGIIWTATDLAELSKRSFVVEYHITSEVPITTATVNGDAVTVTYNTTTGKYDISYTKETNVGDTKVYDADNSTAWTLVATNENGYNTTHALKFVQIDLTNPTNNAPTTSNTLDAKAVDDWYQEVVLSVSVSDLEAGIESIIATNVDDAASKDIFNGEKGATSWSGTAIVNESTGGNPTEGTITVKDRAGNTKVSNFSYKVDKTNPEAYIKVNNDPKTGTVYLDSIPEVKFVATDDNINDSLTKVYVGDDTTGISVAEANAKADFAALVGETPQQNKEYKFKLEVYDKSGRVTTTDLTVVLDSVAPVATITVLTPAERTTGYYNKNNEYVELKLEVKDTNVKTVTVTDETEGNTIDITPATDAWTKTTDGWSTTVKITSEGTHKISMKAEDMSNLTDEADPCTIHIDRTDPEVTTLLNDAAYTAMSSYQVTPVTTGVSVKDRYEDTTNGVTVKISKEIPSGGSTTDNKTGKGPFTLTDDGIYTVEYVVTDLAGNSVTKTIGFTLDSSAPVHNIYVSTGAAKSSKYSNEYSNKVGKFENEEYTYGKYFNTDVFLDVAYFDYNMASVTVYDNDVPVDVTWSKDGAYGRGTIAISSEGYHEIKMSSEDYSGNKVTDSGFSAVYFTIDKTAPVLTTYLDGEAYADTTAHREKAIAQVGVADDNPDEDDISITVERQPNSGASETTIYYGLNGLEYTLDGYYTVTYNVSDKAGNPANISCGFTIDNTSPVHNMYVLTDNPAKFSSYKNNYNNPVGVFASRPSQESYEYGQYYGSDVSVELNVYDYNLDWVYVTDNGAEISPSWTWDGPYGKAVVTLSSEGYHELKMWSKDLSGNETEDTEVGQKVRLYVDKTSPSITTYVNSSLYTEGSGVRYLNTNASVSVSVNDANKDSTDLVRTSKMTPPGGSSSSQTDNIGETTENYSTEADYEVTYVATDLAGNKSATRNVQFRVDKTPPQLSITGDGTSTAKSVAVSFGIKEAFYWDMTSAKYSIYKKAEGTAEALEKTVDFTPRSANDSQSYTLTDDAEYRFEFSAEDKCGNKTEMKGTLIKDGTAPVIMLSGVSNYDKTDKNVTLNVSVDEAFYSSNKVTLTGTRTDINGKKTNIDFNQFVTNRSKISNLEQLFEEDGIYDITVTSTDKAGNTSSKSLHFTIDTTDPEIGDLSKYDGVKTNKFEWDIDLDDLVKDLTVCDITVYMDGSLYDGTSEIADGSHVLRVEAVDELGHKSFKEVTFVLDTKGPNIIISNVEDGDRLLESTDVTVTVEIDEDILDTVSLNDKSVTVTDNKATFTVNAKGKYRINATAHDEAGNMSSTEIQFSFGKQMNIKLIAIIAGAAILLLILLLVLIKRRRDNAYY